MAPHLLRAVGDGTRPSALPGPPEDRAGGRPECRGGGAALSPARGIRRRRNSAPGVGVGVGSASPLTSEGTSPWPQAIGRAWRRSKTRSPGQGLCMVGDGTGQVSGRAAGRGFSGGAPGAPPAPCPAGTASRPLPSPFPEPAGVRGPPGQGTGVCVPGRSGVARQLALTADPLPIAVLRLGRVQ